MTETVPLSSETRHLASPHLVRRNTFYNVMAALASGPYADSGVDLAGRVYITVAMNTA